jgi:hydroxymethylpyrimidine pyrophosphatase-like HAD family hydrolase
MREIKMVVLDMDGTILDHTAEGQLLPISDAVKDAIRRLRQAGVVVSIATGRSHGFLQSYLSDLGVSDGYHVMCNGAATVDPQGNYIHLHSIAQGDYTAITQQFVQHQIPFASFDAQWSYCLPYTADAGYDPYRGECTTSLDVLSMPLVTKMLIGPCNFKQVATILEPYDVAFALANALGNEYVEVWPKTIHKGLSIEAIAKIYDISLANIMAIGDGANDKEMLMHVGFGVAMGNAKDDLKAVAKATTLSIGQDGVAHAVEKYVFKSEFL